MDLNTLAKRVTQVEGKKVQVNIGQVKEVISALNKVLKEQGVNLYTIVRNI